MLIERDAERDRTRTVGVYIDNFEIAKKKVSSISVTLSK